MASIIVSFNNSPQFLLPTNPNSSLLSCSSPSPSLIYFPPFRTYLHLRYRPFLRNGYARNSKIGCLDDTHRPDLLRKPSISSIEEGVKKGSFELSSSDDHEEDEEEEKRDEDEWVDWEDQILEDTVPLVGFVRMILHSGKYESGDRLSPEHEKTIVERLLPYHPECEKKIGSGIDYIKVGYHPDFDNSRCMFIVRKDGKSVDFSYWKCIKGLIRKNYPLYADSFILRHFRQRRRSE